jgi:hypothetical protein
MRHNRPIGTRAHQIRLQHELDMRRTAEPHRPNEHHRLHEPKTNRLRQVKQLLRALQLRVQERQPNDRPVQSSRVD